MLYWIKKNTNEKKKKIKYKYIYILFSLIKIETTSGVFKLK